MKSNVLLCIITGLSISFLISQQRVDAAGQSLSVYPPVIEIQTEPPSSPSVPIVIHNNNTEDVMLKIELIPIKQLGEAGDITIVPELSEKGFYKYYKDKVQLLLEGKKVSTIELQALESKELELNVNLAKGDPPGDFYYAVTFISSGSGPSETSIVKIPNGIGTNLLLSIGPKDKSTGGISQFRTSNFTSKGPVDFEIRLHNASKHLIQPTGRIEITNIFGSKQGIIEILPQYVLAGSDRYLVDTIQNSDEAKKLNDTEQIPKVVWPEKFLLGMYKAKAIIQLEANGPTIEAVTYFFAFPLYLFIPLVIIIFSILGIYLKVRKKI